MRSRIALTAAMVLLIAACGGDAQTDRPLGPNAIGGARVVLVAELTGGCGMIGPNCPSYVLWSDGRAAVLRGAVPVDPFSQTLGDGAIEQFGFIDEAVATALAVQVDGTDFVALIARLPPGECMACYDGIDSTLRLAAPSGVVILSSVDVLFDREEAFFAAMQDALDAMGDVLPLEVRIR